MGAFSSKGPIGKEFNRKHFLTFALFRPIYIPSIPFPLPFTPHPFSTRLLQAI